MKRSRSESFAVNEFTTNVDISKEKRNEIISQESNAKVNNRTLNGHCSIGNSISGSENKNNRALLNDNDKTGVNGSQERIEEERRQQPSIRQRGVIFDEGRIILQSANEQDSCAYSKMSNKHHNNNNNSNYDNINCTKSGDSVSSSNCSSNSSNTCNCNKIVNNDIMWPGDGNSNSSDAMLQTLIALKNKQKAGACCCVRNDNSHKTREMRLCGKYYLSDIIDVALRIIGVVLFIKLELSKPFQRDIHLEELWLYKNPRMPDIVTPRFLVVAVIICPFALSLAHLYLTKNRRDFRAASWTWTLTLCLNGILTSFLKITVGRPRPDFFYRCFPDGRMVLANMTDPTDPKSVITGGIFNCTGDVRAINEGFKSFPSGHSSFAFASFGFISYFLAAKLHTFNAGGRGETWRLCITMTPLLYAVFVAVSRTCDYHHHWQDVTIGALIGLLISYTVYRQYYPSIFEINSHKPLSRCPRAENDYHYNWSRFKNYMPLATSDVLDVANESESEKESEHFRKVEKHIRSHDSTKKI